MADQCNGLFGRLFGHKFEPVYNSFPPTFEGFKLNGTTADEFVELVHAMTREEVVGVWCTRCGKRSEVSNG